MRRPHRFRSSISPTRDDSRMRIHAGPADEIASKSWHSPDTLKARIRPRCFGPPVRGATRRAPVAIRMSPQPSSQRQRRNAGCPRVSNTRCSRSFDRPARSAPAAIEALHKSRRLRKRVQTCDERTFLQVPPNAAIITPRGSDQTSADSPVLLKCPTETPDRRWLMRH